MRLILGSNGGLGKTFIKYCKNKSDIFFSKKKLDILNSIELEEKLSSCKINSLINFAAYTDVPRAEKNVKQCFEINSLSLNNICELVNSYNIKLYHISTDYVFSNSKINNEKQKTNPTNIYGLSKKYGEEIIKSKCNNYSIIRTSWLFNEYRKDFLGKILKKINNNETINMNYEEGCPTSCKSLAKFIDRISLENKKTKEILHFRNFPEISRKDFVKKIIAINNKKNKFLYKKRIKQIFKFDNVDRPNKSFLNCENTFKKYKIRKTFWYDELKQVI